MLKNDFSPRQQMICSDFEYFHYRDDTNLEVEYHNHDFYEVYIFLSGKVTYIIEGKSYRLRPGDIVLISDKELHKPAIELGEPYERIVIWVNPLFIKNISLEDSNLSMCFQSSSEKRYNLLRPGLELSNHIKSIVWKLEKACGSDGYGSKILRSAYLTELLVFLNKAYIDSYDEEIEDDIRYDEKVDRVITYINNNLNGVLSLETLAARFYTSKYHLLREFKKHSGYTLHHYIRRKRLIMAKSLLREGTQVSEVCDICGFGDYSNFIRTFKKEFGLPPKKYYKNV